MGKFAEATQPLRKLITDYRGTSPLVNKAYMQLGVVSFRQGNYSAAANYYKQVFTNNPEAQEAKDALALLKETYDEMGRPDEYLAFLETVPGYKLSNSSRDSITYQSAEYQYQNGRYQQAIDGFTNYLNRYSNSNGQYVIEAYYYRAESYASDDIKKYNLAINDYAAIIAKGSSRWYLKSAERAARLSLNEEKKPAQALEYARKWEDAAPNEAVRLNAQLVALEAAYKSGNNSVAVTEYANKVNNSSLATSEQLALANFYLGKIAFDRGDYTRAYPTLESVTENTNTEIMAESYHLMAQILYKQKKHNEAEELITERANKNSAGYDDWIARNLILLSDIYLDQGDKNSASAALENVLEYYKGNDPNIINVAQQKYDKIKKAPTTPQPDNNSTEKGGGNFLEMDGGN
jgi:TolA-binding protein